ncbi:MAG: porin family protein [Vicinamibacterales bacterium]|nr:porin family protein [Vicinamibacterales bacterium]
MLKLLVSACAFTLLVCTSSAAFAQDHAVSANVLVGVGSTRAGSGLDGLANVGFKLTDYVSLNGEFATLSFKGYLSDSEFSKTTHTAFRYSGNLRFGYAEESLVQPYLTAGLGAINLKNADGSRGTEVLPVVGLGFDLWPSKYVGAGIHYRTLFVDNGTYHTFIAGVTFGIR